MREGRRLGLDVGSARTGVAISDREGLVATPRESAPGGADGLTVIAQLIADEDVIEVVIGVPRSLSGARGAAEERVREWCRDLAALTPVPLRLVDERLTTHQAARGLRASGANSQQARGRVDSAAAAVILQHALDTERSRGEAPGEVLA